MGYEMEIEREKAARVSLRQKKIRSNLTGWLFVAPFLLVFVIFTIYPFFYGIAMSFCRYDVLGRVDTEFIGFENYQTIFEFGTEANHWAKDFWNGLGNKPVQPLSDGWWKVDDSAKKVRLEQKFDLKKFRTPRLWFGLGCYNLEMESAKNLTLKPGDSWNGSLTWTLSHFN